MESVGTGAAAAAGFHEFVVHLRRAVVGCGEELHVGWCTVGWACDKITQIDVQYMDMFRTLVARVDEFGKKETFLRNTTHANEARIE